MTTPPPELLPGQSIALLQELHILTRDGKLNQDSRRKLKQVHHLYQFIEKLLDEVPASAGGAALVDHGAGKSYLASFFTTCTSSRAGWVRCLASRRGPSWSSVHAPWRSAWVSSACIFCI